MLKQTKIAKVVGTYNNLISIHLQHNPMLLRSKPHCAQSGFLSRTAYGFATLPYFLQSFDICESTQATLNFSKQFVIKIYLYTIIQKIQWMEATNEKKAQITSRFLNKLRIFHHSCGLHMIYIPFGRISTNSFLFIKAKFAFFCS